MKQWLLVFFLLIPAATALEVTLETPTALLIAGGPPESATIAVTMDCQEAGLNPDSVGQTSFLYSVDFETMNSEIKVAGPESILLNCPTPFGTATGSAKFFLSANVGPAAHLDHAVNVIVSGAGQTADDSGVVRVAEYFVISMSVDGRAAEDSKGPSYSAEYPVKVTNQGNSAINIRFSSNETISFEPMSTLGIGDTQTIEAKVSETVFGPANEIWTYDFFVTPVDALTETEGDAMKVSVILRGTGGGAQSLGGFFLVAVIVAVAVLLVIAKRRSM